MGKLSVKTRSTPFSSTLYNAKNIRTSSTDVELNFWTACCPRRMMTEGVSSPSPRSLGIMCTSSTEEDNASLSWAMESKWNLKAPKKKSTKTGKGVVTEAPKQISQTLPRRKSRRQRLETASPGQCCRWSLRRGRLPACREPDGLGWAVLKLM